MTTLLRDVISIPDSAGADDYVLRLTEGVGRGRIATTLHDYVVTDDLAGAFDQALDLVGNALAERTSRAAFLTGSFGSGKSHFMAVLHALLGNDPGARAIPELAPVIAKHDATLADKRILRLAYHLIGSESLEQAVLGHYVAQVSAIHPDAPLPAVYRAEAVLEDAERLRSQLGDDAFLAGLNGGRSAAATAGDPWGGVLGEGTWTAESYDAARAAAPRSDARQALVSALVRTYFTAYTSHAEFVDLDTGLAAISSHAKALGYDAVVLFLDELVLWLAFRVKDTAFFSREAQKLTKLVESASGERAVPLVSFVARQVDLRRFFAGAGAVGAEQEALEQAFRHQEGRFRSIVLGDDNLPYVAQKRLLAPSGPDGQAALDDAFRRLDRRPEVWDVLLDGVNTDERHRGADQDAFRRTYPFSPALVSTLRALASAMQRERTVLKIMQQLLVDQRGELTVDDVIPVGDVFDLVVEGNQALSPEMAGRFRAARTLFEDRLRPVILREHGLGPDEAAGLPRTHPVRADERLAKTLVMSAVAPEVPALKELTASRLAALNHGSIVSPLPGEEATVALSKITRWNAEVPEIQVGQGRNPVIRVRLAEVDYEGVVDRAKGEDNDGRRRELLKALVWEALDLGADLQGDLLGVVHHDHVWRGSRRDVEVVFGNVRDASWLTEAHFRAGPGTWRFVVDYPFDDAGRSASDDLHRLDELADRLVSRTLVWVPRFLARERLDDLGRLVVLDWLLGGTGERWTAHADHLAEADRVQAKIILETQRDALRARLRQAVQQAYGAAAPTVGTLEDDPRHDRVLVSLDPAFRPGAPVGADLHAAFHHLLDQAFTSTYPKHPRFEPGDREVRPAELAAVLHAVESALQMADRRIVPEPREREPLRRVAGPLGIGTMGEQAFNFTDDRFPWALAFERAIGRAGLSSDQPVTVGQARGWIETLQPAYGLRPEVADLVICAWAARGNRAWYRHGGPIVPEPRPGTLTTDMELRPEPLPAAEDWAKAVPRVAALFGVPGNPYLTGANVAAVATNVREHAARLREGAAALGPVLADAHRALGLPVDAETGRRATADAAGRLVAALVAAPNPVALVETLARTPLPATDQAVAKSLSSAPDVAAALRSFRWERITPLKAAERGGDERGLGAKAILDRLRAAVAADELVHAVVPALRKADDEAFGWVSGPTPPSPPPPPAAPHLAGGRVRVAPRAGAGEAVEALQAFVREHADEPVVVEWRVERP